jgi:hypothetical protein
MIMDVSRIFSYQDNVLDRQGATTRPPALALLGGLEQRHQARHQANVRPGRHRLAARR